LDQEYLVNACGSVPAGCGQWEFEEEMMNFYP
jgi:hypothetical protein